MTALKQTLIRKLEAKGLYPGTIPGFLKNLAAYLSENPHLNLVEVNHKLSYLGWEEIELDYHTFQLAKCWLESETAGE
ncbi:MAG: hypothetical protein JRH18_03675 [Deltaproteobacteria bacterium]|nr:hypothetical protein [Deltaproteobacteria bacterium]MBW2150748.1 hypothetical protein [Deltaproteobacteria bacterium]